MEVRKEQIDETTVALEVVVDADTVRAAMARRYQSAAQRVAVPGFRKGKVPPELLDRVLDHEALQREAVNALIGPVLAEAAKQVELRPLGPGSLEKAEMQQDLSLRLRAQFVVRPEVDLGEYHGLRTTRRKVRITPEDVERELQRLAEARSRHQPMETVATGDLAVVDFEIVPDGAAEPAVSEHAYPLQVGSETLFPELNETLVGATVGEEKVVPVTFAGDHRDARLAGKAASVRLTVREAKRRIVPVTDDAFARTVSDCKDLDELRARIATNLQLVNDQLAENDVHDDLMRQLVRQAKAPIPKLLVAREVEESKGELLADLARHNQRLEDYLARRGLSEEAWATHLRLDAESRLERALVLAALGEREAVAVTDEEVTAEVARRAQREGMSVNQMRKQLEQRDELSTVRTRLYNIKVLRRLVELATITEEDATNAETVPAD